MARVSHWAHARATNVTAEQRSLLHHQLEICTLKPAVRVRVRVRESFTALGRELHGARRAASCARLLYFFNRNPIG
jgi:hypothetical protein